MFESGLLFSFKVFVFTPSIMSLWSLFHGQSETAESTPVIKLILQNSTTDVCYFGANEEDINRFKAQEPKEALKTYDLTANDVEVSDWSTITIADAQGNSKKSANEHLEFSVLQFAADQQDRDNSVKIHVGAASGQTISIGLSDMRAESLGLQSSDAKVISVATPEKANAAISAFDYALAKALDQATTIGAIEARLDYTSSNLTTESENVQAAESTIRDADMAKEMTNYTKNNVLLQAAQSMLAQANQNSSAVLSLLQ